MLQRGLWSIVAVLSLLLPGYRAAAQGIIIGPDARPAPLTMTRHDVQARVQEQVAVVTVEQVFHNPGAGTVEGTFLFPLPPEAQVTRFSMEVDGREMAGELLPADEARRIYEDIVRRSLDPALLEMADYRTFRARVFPIPGGASRKITLRYDATLPREGNTVRFTFPLQGALSTRGAAGPPPPPRPPLPRPHDEAPRPPATTAGLSAIRVEVEAQAGLKNLYSPSHDVAIEQPTDRRAVVRYEGREGLDGRDFVLYYSLDPGALGATALTYRPYSDRPGYFMVLVSPQVQLASGGVQPRDVVFVLDTSGSMAGAKMEQAKNALTYCLNRLGERDRFGIVAFSSDVDAFRPALTALQARDDARFFVSQLEAAGGTNIHAALVAAVRMLQESENGMIIFLTDGLPSTGVTDEGQIRAAVQKENRQRLRIFSFGVGYDVNTHLLDGLSRATGAFADYISPEENIEERVSAFYEKVRYPVMTDLRFTLDGVDAYAFAPAELPDLYKGGQLILAGRYRRPGEAVLTLRGRTGTREETKQYRLRFPETERTQDFVGRLWATRRVGLLLDEIRLQGESPALKEEVVALAKEFGLVTPYTSYLVQEEEPVAGLPSLRPASPGPPPPGAAHRLVAPEDLRATTGAAAVQMSKNIRAMQEATAAPMPEAVGVVTVQGRTLRQAPDSGWVDVAFTPGTRTVPIAFASETYFTFLRQYPEVLAFARLGERVVFAFRGRFVEIAAEGRDFSGAALQALFGRSAAGGPLAGQE